MKVFVFYQDDYDGTAANSYGNLGLGQEFSRSSFVIYEKDKFWKAYDDGVPYSGYLQELQGFQEVAPHTYIWLLRR